MKSCLSCRYCFKGEISGTVVDECRGAPPTMILEKLPGDRFTFSAVYTIVPAKPCGMYRRRWWWNRST